MSRKLLTVAAILATLAVFDGVIDLVEWIGNFDVFVAASLGSLVSLLFAMLLDKRTVLGSIANYCYSGVCNYFVHWWNLLWTTTFGVMLQKENPKQEIVADPLSEKEDTKEEIVTEPLPEKEQD